MTSIYFVGDTDAMPSATIAVKGTASEEFPADFAGIHFQHHFTLPARSDAMAHGNAVIAQVREVGAQPDVVRETKVGSFRVGEVFDSVGPDPSGWSVHVAGEVYTDTVSVSAVVASLIKVGVSISHISWHLDPETAAGAHRAVRRQAVGDALQAANDFASALGGTVGNLITLADPGLLGAGSHAGNSAVATRAASAFSASATSPTTPWNENVDIDPYAVTVSASVEASYVVNLD
jgi:uncharacterized protein YggE